MKKGISTILTVCLTAVIVLGIVAGGYYYIDKQNKDEKAAINARITALESELTTAKKSNIAETATSATTNTATTTTTDTTANWNTYTNLTYGFSFKYPTDFKVTELTDMPGGLEVSINPNNKIFKAHDENIDLFSMAWHQNFEVTTLAEFVSGISADSKTAAEVGIYNATKAVNINNADVNQVVFETNGGIHSFYSRIKLLQDSSAITSAEATAYNTDFDQILFSFRLI